MTARVLVVDDVPSNVKLLEARLMAEYFHVLTATNGRDALQICIDGRCDIVLLDVMMPEMDGYEVCRRLKADPRTVHLPVVMVTALDQTDSKVKGLEAGADDFLTKPVNDLALVTRVKSLVRLKMLSDDLRFRVESGDEMVIGGLQEMDAEKARVVIVDDKEHSYSTLASILREDYDVEILTQPHDALVRLANQEFDLVIISANIDGHDSLRLCSYLRSLEKTRNLPIIIVTYNGQENIISRALEMGINDYLHQPLDRHEVLARVKTQMRRKRYNDCLRTSVQKTIEMAIKDPLTGLYNRRYFDTHFPNMVDKATKNGSALSAIMCDIDHFKSVNDKYGHAVGDQVIKECTDTITRNIRNIDLACRYGGEEFVIIMPETSHDLAGMIAERIREEIASHLIKIGNESDPISVTASMGIATLEEGAVSPEQLLKSADQALYTAKREGRNKVVSTAA